jgi:hypothetical protein
LGLELLISFYVTRFYKIRKFYKIRNKPFKPRCQGLQFELLKLKNRCDLKKRFFFFLGFFFFFAFLCFFLFFCFLVGV